MANLGTPLLFTSRVVTGDMKVLREPSVDPLREPRRAIEEMLADHDLTLREASGRLVVVAQRIPSSPPAPAGDGGEPGPTLEAKAMWGAVNEEVTVLSRRQSEPFAEAVVRGSTDERAKALPHIANDLFHAAKVVPATSSAESSSRLSIRGGNTAELLVLLDGQEILEPYHLQDFDSALSILAPPIVESAALHAGGFPTRYGGRMGGVFDLTTVAPARDLRGRTSLGPWYADIGGSGRLASGRGSWMALGRAGSYRLALAVAGRNENPQFWDFFGKIQFDLGEEQRHSLQIEALLADDEIHHGESAPDIVSEYTARWSNGLVWALDLRLFSPRVYVETSLAAGRLARVRHGFEAGPERDLALDDVRGYDSVTGRQAWMWEPTRWAGHSFDSGFEIRHLDADFEYFSRRELRDFLAPLRSQGASGSVTEVRDLYGEYLGVYVSDDWLLGGGREEPWRQLRLTLGARWDDDSLVDDHQLSPRLALTWTPTPRLNLRSSWGVFHQSRRPYELQVEDGETELPVAERAEHVTFGGDYRTTTGMLVSLEGYERDLDQLRVRYENLFEPISLFPELSSDRLRVAPTTGRSRGYELAVRGPVGHPIRWAASYTHGAVTETVGRDQIPRAMDQTHAVRLELGHLWPSGWQLHLALTYHSGWPTTQVTASEVVAEDGGTSLEPHLGALRQERLPDYYRLDLRAGRSWNVALRGESRGHLEFFLDLQNVLDRDNVRGYEDFTVGYDIAARPVVSSQELMWSDFLPSFGLSLDF